MAQATVRAILGLFDAGMFEISNITSNFKHHI
jgi:hypothetical protein